MIKYIFDLKQFFKYITEKNVTKSKNIKLNN